MMHPSDEAWAIWYANSRGIRYEEAVQILRDFEAAKERAFWRSVTVVDDGYGPPQGAKHE